MTHTIKIIVDKVSSIHDLSKLRNSYLNMRISCGIHRNILFRNTIESGAFHSEYSEK